MATSKNTPIDITKTGPAGFRQLQNANSQAFTGISPEFMQFSEALNNMAYPTSLYDARVHAQQDVVSPLLGQQTMGRQSDYWGRSVWDNPTATQEQFGHLGDIRAENQPWYSKIINGVGKAGVLAGTTALETLGLLYGIGQGIYDASNAEEGKGGEAFLHGLWDNPITNALQAVNDASEDLMPNYYTQDEQENPWGNIFTANFLGDKLLKNLGFMVGAFYGGIPGAGLIGRAGTTAVKAARAASLAERAGMAARVARIGEEVAETGLKGAARTAKINKLLRLEGLTEAERGARIVAGMDKVKDIAQTTRATSQVLGSLGSAINEGAIEALNNSRDWADLMIQEEDDAYQKKIADIDSLYGGTEMETPLKMQVVADHEKKLEEIEKGKAKMGNADLLLNIPILTMSNMIELGRLYTRGFDSTRRQMGSFWNGNKLSGSLKEGTLKSDKTWKGAIAKGLINSNSEGMEEYLQRAASDGAGKAVTDSINRFMESGKSEDSKVGVDNYIAGFGKAIADNLGDPNAWEEYFIGAVSALAGMPVFGSQTKNAYIGKGGPIGLAGGFVGEYQNYMRAKEDEERVANYLNGRVKDPKFKKLYDNLRKQEDYNKWLQDEIAKGDKSEYKDLELEKFYQDINAAASSGHLEEFKQLVGYNKDYTDKELEDIVKETSRTISPEQQKKRDENMKSYLQGQLSELINEGKDSTKEAKDIEKELSEINKRLDEDNYQEKLEGPFVNRNGQMNVTDPDKMREVLNRNRENLLQGIDDYLKIRNDIDIETDGNLDDDQIALLTQMKGKILDYEKRSAEMSYDLVDNLGGVLENQQEWRDKIQEDLNKAQQEYDKAKVNWESVKDKKGTTEAQKKQAEKSYLESEKKLKKAKTADKSVNNAIKLLEMLREEKDTTALERAAEAKGEGKGILGRVGAALNRFKDRAINSDEAQAIVANPVNAMSLLSLINNKTSGLDENTKGRLTQEVLDLTELANKKIAYNQKVREFLGDKTKIEEYQNKASDKDKGNKAEELSLRIKEATSMADLDQIMRESSAVDPDIARMGLQKAKETASEETKQFLDDYEKGVSFYGNFAQQAQKLDPETATGVSNTAASAWEYALSNNEGNLYDAFVNAMKDAANDLDETGGTAEKKTADGIRQVLKDLDVGAKSVATNKKVKKSVAKGTSSMEESSEGEEGGLGAMAALRKKDKSEEGKKEEPKKEDKEEPVPDTKDSLIKDIEKELKGFKVDKTRYANASTMEGLSSELKERINKYNTEHPDDQVTDAIILDMMNKIVDEDIADDESNLNEDDIKNDDSSEVGDEDDGSGRAERMHDNLKVSFKSDHPTQFRYNLDFKLPYAPDSEQLKAVQALLERYKAYQFLDKNYLGYIANVQDGHPVIHFLKSTDSAIDGNGGGESIIFMAIEWDSKAEKAVRDSAFNGNPKANLQDEVSPVTINGKQYQIVGVMTLNSEVAPEVSKAFAGLQGALNNELDPQMETARTNGQEFVISNLTSEVDQIYTGRLEKRTDEIDSGTKVSLYDFVNTPQKEGDRASTEFQNGMNFYFGTVINGYLNTTDNEDVLSMMEQPNDKWMEKNNGAIVMFVPKPDGKLYPVRCQRRTVKDWLKANDNAYGKTGEELLGIILNPDTDSNVVAATQNDYIDNIITYIITLFDEEATIGDKMNAKIMLNKYFIFGKQSPIHFNGEDVSLIFDGRTYNLDAETVEEKVMQFFNALSDENIMFTLPADSIESIDGRAIIKSGIFEIGLRGFYNFNANFTIYPINEYGNFVKVEPDEGEGSHFAGGNNVRATEVQFDLGDGMQAYVIEGDGTVTQNGSPVSADKQNLVTLAMQAERGKLPSFIMEQLSVRYKNPEIKKLVAEGIEGFEGIYIIHSDEDWIYDGRKGNHEVRLYILNSFEGTKLKNSLNQAISDFNESHMSEIKALKESSKTPLVSAEQGIDSISSLIATMIDVMKGKMSTKELAELEMLFREINPNWSDEKIESAIEDAYRTIGKLKWWYNADAFMEKGVGRQAIRRAILGSNRTKFVEPQSPKSKSSGKESLQVTRFTGKTMDDFDLKDGGLDAIIAGNKKSPVVKKVFAALQDAEQTGILFDSNEIAVKLKNILNANKDEKRQMLDDLLNELKGCNKK